MTNHILIIYNALNSLFFQFRWHKAHKKWTHLLFLTKFRCFNLILKMVYVFSFSSEIIVFFRRIKSKLSYIDTLFSLYHSQFVINIILFDLRSKLGSNEKHFPICLIKKNTTNISTACSKTMGYFIGFIKAMLKS